MSSSSTNHADSNVNEKQHDVERGSVSKGSVPKGRGILQQPFLPAMETRSKMMWDRFNGKGKRHIGVVESLKAIALSSWLNVLLVLIPVAWASHFLHWHFSITFALCFLSIIPMEKLFDWGGEEMSKYLGLNLGDLLVITLNNAVEATLAIILVAHCELRILQATIAGVVILHLLLIPGTAFLVGGSSMWEQHLHPHTAQLNNSLLTIGVFSLLIPTAFFSALGGNTTTTGEAIVTDAFRGEFLQMSRGTSIILLIIYIGSRIFIANPPGEDNAGAIHPDAPQAVHDAERELAEAQPEVNSWVCSIMLIITIGIMAATAEFLVESIEPLREAKGIREEWFGLILLPLVSFSADGAVAIVFFAQASVAKILGRADTEVPATLAKARSIDLSIQFTLFWMPFLVLLSWWTNASLTLLFDLYEVALLLGSTFLVNYVTQDAKTNWVEGLILVSFYVMIGIWTWFYTGQADLEAMYVSGRCTAEAVGEATGEHTGAVAAELVRRLL